MSEYELLEDLESFESDPELDEELEALLESDESRPRRRPVRTGRGAGYYRPQAASNKGVSQRQLQETLHKIENDVKANAAGIKAVGARVDAAAAGQKKLSAVVKKEAAGRRKDLAKLKSGMQMAAILPMLTTKTITVGSDAMIGGTAIPAGTKLQVAPDGMGAMLPLLLMGGLGGGGGDDSGNTMLLALAFAGGT